jgi:succinate dehydrogenase / fumarate reductase cytochrome b subunit
MRFIDAPKKVKTDVGFEHVVEISEDPGVYSLAKRLDAKVQKTALETVQVVAKNPGVAMLFMVRDKFKSIWVSGFYTIFVMAAAYHAWNGFWTFLITWGIVLSYRAQRSMIPVSVIGMGVSIALGLAAIWLSYWVNLRN